MRIGEQGKLKTTQLILKQEVMWHIENTRGEAFPRGSGQFTGVGKGQTLAVGMGSDEDLGERIKFWEGQLREQGYDKGSIRLTSADYVITYAVDGADRNPRSGRCVAQYRIPSPSRPPKADEPLRSIVTALMGFIGSRTTS
jgi:hypothetical protein